MTQRIWHWIAFLALTSIFTTGTAAADTPGEVQEKVVYHVTDSNIARGALNNARNHLDATEGKTKIVFVTHGGGIDFLVQGATDKDGNPYDVAIEKLQGRGVEFRVCNNTLRARKVDPKTLVDGSIVVPSGIAEVARLQSREGYVYIKP